MNTADLVASPAREASEHAAAQAPDGARHAGKRGWGSLLGWAAVLAILGGTWHGADMRPLDLISDSGNMGQFAKDFFPPDFSEWRSYLQEMFVTLSVAVWGTALALVFAVPCGLLSASNI